MVLEEANKILCAIRPAVKGHLWRREVVKRYYEEQVLKKHNTRSSSASQLDSSQSRRVTRSQSAKSVNWDYYDWNICKVECYNIRVLSMTRVDVITCNSLRRLFSLASTMKFIPIILFLIIAVFATSGLGISCLDGSGNAVDWFAALKVPDNYLYYYSMGGSTMSVRESICHQENWELLLTIFFFTRKVQASKDQLQLAHLVKRLALYTSSRGERSLLQSYIMSSIFFSQLWWLFYVWWWEPRW